MKSTRECMQALLDDHTLIDDVGNEVSLDKEGNWNGYKTSVFHNPQDWSIKPEPRVIYVNEYGNLERDGSRSLSGLSTSEDYMKQAGSMYDSYIRTVKFVEVVE